MPFLPIFCPTSEAGGVGIFSHMASDNVAVLSVFEDGETCFVGAGCLSLDVSCCGVAEFLSSCLTGLKKSSFSPAISSVNLVYSPLAFTDGDGTGSIASSSVSLNNCPASDELTEPGYCVWAEGLIVARTGPLVGSF